MQRQYFIGGPWRRSEGILGRGERHQYDDLDTAAHERLAERGVDLVLVLTV